jgi:hypothetical protein
MMIWFVFLIFLIFFFSLRGCRWVREMREAGHLEKDFAEVKADVRDSVLFQNALSFDHRTQVSSEAVRLVGGSGIAGSGKRESPSSPYSLIQMSYMPATATSFVSSTRSITLG